MAGKSEDEKVKITEYSWVYKTKTSESVNQI